MKSYNLYLYALDPTHIGSGGYRLGRVDNTILRDAGTQLPKIPGSSISGTTRSAAIYSLDKNDREIAMRYANATLGKEGYKREHSGKDDPVAKIFGFAEGDEDGTSQIGAVSFRDAEILAFPIPTMLGTKWITTAYLLKCVGINIPEPTSEEEIFVQENTNRPKQLNLGWLLFTNISTKKIPFVKDIKFLPTENIKNNLIVVHENIFTALVNANLETRTSVSIDFETGSACSGALFTYEATPRGTLFRGRIDFDDKRFNNERYPGLENDWKRLVEEALKLSCNLGLGAMTTRGFGRMQHELVDISNNNK